MQPLIFSILPMWALSLLTPSIVHHPTLRLHLLYLSFYIIVFFLTNTSAIMAFSAPLNSNWCLSELPFIFPHEKDTYIFEEISQYGRGFLKLYDHASISLLWILHFQLYDLGVDVWISQNVNLMLCNSCSSLLTFLGWRYKNLVISFGNHICSLFSRRHFETGIDWWSVWLPPQ